jgi:1-acyl-sn-glycerol-3-phosphate acyltransferase
MTTKPVKPNYAQLEDSQLKWPHIFYQWVVVTSLKIYICLRYKFVVEGLENCPKDWVPMVIAANHTSSLDPPLVSVALHFRPISYLAKKELFINFWMRNYNIAMASISVNRQKLELSTIKSTHKVLKSGKWALGIFPEGSRKKGGEALADAKKGVAYFARSGKVPVLPLGIAHIPDKPRNRVHVCVGKPIPYQEDLDAFTEAIQKSIQGLVERAKHLK